MGHQEIDIRTTTSADPAAVWSLLNDSSSWPSWTPIEDFELVAAGDSDGLGEVRTFTTGRVTVREEIVERKQEKRLSYELLGGLAVRDYRADVDLAPSPDGRGTEIRWHTTFKPRVPGSGWLYLRALDKATRQFVDGLARHAEQLTTAPGDETSAGRP